MAVPTGRNGMRGDDDEGDNDVLEEMVFGENEAELVEDDDDIPPHLRALAAAAEGGGLDALRDALDNLSGSIDDPVEDGDTALHLCCLYGHLPCVQLLLERGANIEAKDEEGAIPLHDACAGGFMEIVQALVNTGDSERVQRMLITTDDDGDTPLHHAARGEHLAVVQFLLTLGSSPTKANFYGKTPAELADPNTEVRRYLEDAASASYVS